MGRSQCGIGSTNNRRKDDPHLIQLETSASALLKGCQILVRLREVEGRGREEESHPENTSTGTEVTAASIQATDRLGAAEALLAHEDPEQQ